MAGESKKWLRFRIVTLLVFFLVLFVALISRAFQIQILSGKMLKNLAERQHIKTLDGMLGSLTRSRGVRSCGRQRSHQS